jgi:Tfp pilus assembly major pilin PilA
MSRTKKDSPTSRRSSNARWAKARHSTKNNVRRRRTSDRTAIAVGDFERVVVDEKKLAWKHTPETCRYRCCWPF